MFCGNCGNVLADTSTVCDRCGTPLKRSYHTNTLNIPAVPAAEPENQPMAQNNIPETQPEPVYASQSAPEQHASYMQEPAPQYTAPPEPEYYPEQTAPAYDRNMYSYDQPEPEYCSPLVLKTNYRWWKMFLLGIITLGIYPLIMNEQMVHDLNITASRYDGRKTLSPMLADFLAVITLFVFYFVYENKYANRLGRELRRRGINYKISAGYFWLLNVLFCFTIVCPLIYYHRKIKATNLINKHFNEYGM